MRFRITRHSVRGAPPDALELLSERLGPSRSGVSFSNKGAEITATWRDDAPISRTEDERASIGRLAVLELVQSVCEREPQLKAEWFAVSLGR